nr:ABC transporter ATP-binding protein [Pantoea sp. 1.19]
MNNQLLTVSDLQVSAGESVLVDSISFTLAQGEVLGLIGESGAGKSTIGQAVLGHCREGMRITAGAICFDGVDLTRLRERQLRAIRGRRIAYVAQSASASFNPAKPIGEQVIESALRHRVLSRQAAIARAIALFTQLQLPQPAAFFHRYPHQVSGGQLQRAMIAMSLCAGPDLIIFDEPTTALDVTTQLEVLRAIREAIRDSGVAAIYISHDLAVVAQLADRIMVLRQGREVESGETAALIGAPQETYTRDLLNCHGEPHRPRPAAPPLLQVQGVSLRYQQQPILRDISLTLGQGRTLALIGESGAGKSTLGRVICGLATPEQGHVSLAGVPLPLTLRGRSRAELGNIQLIHQHPDTALNPRLTIGQQIARSLVCLTSLNASQRRARVATLLEQVGLPASLASRLPGHLSGGQKQRVCIARALAVEPTLIVCDEPTSALDPLVGRDVLALLRRIQEETGIALLFITHDLQVVRAIADEVMVLRNGATVREGPLDRVFSAPLDDYTATLLRAVPEMRPGWLEAQA